MQYVRAWRLLFEAAGPAAMCASPTPIAVFSALISLSSLRRSAFMLRMVPSALSLPFKASSFADRCSLALFLSLQSSKQQLLGSGVMQRAIVHEAHPQSMVGRKMTKVPTTLIRVQCMQFKTCGVAHPTGGEPCCIAARCHCVV